MGQRRQQCMGVCVLLHWFKSSGYHRWSCAQFCVGGRSQLPPLPVGPSPSRTNTKPGQSRSKLSPSLPHLPSPFIPSAPSVPPHSTALKCTPLCASVRGAALLGSVLSSSYHPSCSLSRLSNRKCALQLFQSLTYIFPRFLLSLSSVLCPLDVLLLAMALSPRPF